MSRSSDPRRFFDPADREAVRVAVAAAEAGTGGEVVPFVVGRSGVYRATAWSAATVAAVLAAGAAAWVYELGGLWGGAGMLWVALPAALAAVIAWGSVTASETLRRILTPAGVLDERVALRAAAAFVEEEVFDTRDRTGVLIFLSLFEHRVVILGDAGINARIEPGEWKEISDGLAARIRAGTAAAGLVQAIEACGQVLERRVERRPDDVDELSDALRLRDA